MGNVKKIYQENNNDFENFVVSEIHNAIKSEQIEVFFQPQIRSVNSRLVGVESLVRWNHPVYGRIAPSKFIPILEKHNLIYKLDKFVWNYVCQCARKMLDKGLNVVPFSVNVSRIDIIQGTFLNDIKAIVDKYNLPNDLIHLEITESAFIKDEKRIKKVVQLLVNSGFVLAIDDFGCGYSSLNVLNDLSIQVLKIDKSFFRLENNLGKNDFIIGAIVQLAKIMGMIVIAEGVENIEQVKMLQTIGCDYIQSYFYSKPLKYADYVEYVKNKEEEKIDFSHIKEEIHLDDSHSFLRKIILGTKDIIMVVDMKTHQLLYANHLAECYYKKRFDFLDKIKCYEFCGEEKKCRRCPAKRLKVGEIKELVSFENDIKFKITFDRINWNGKDAFAICKTQNHIDLNKYNVQKKNDIIGQDMNEKVILL